MKLCKGCFEKYDQQLKVCPHCGYAEDTPPESTLHMLPGTLLNERYIIGKVIGYGGFGVTYIAYDCVLQMKTAVKEYLPSEFATRVVGQHDITIFGGKKEEQFNDGMTKFIEEARNLAKFHSLDGIVKVFNTFEENNTAYIVMELLQGETLAQLLEREKTIPEDKAIKMLKPVMDSLNEVHARSIIHRDIAPDNVFVTNDGKVKLIDFGAARYATTSHSRSLTVIIKPGFSPEEQYRSRGDQGPHTDVYSLAATLYKMITGVTPPDALERRAFLENKGKEILKPPAKFAHDISVNTENAILNAMNVRIEDRTPNMAEFYKELTSDTPVKRRAGKVQRTNFYRWPLWAKIGFPAAAAALMAFLILLRSGAIVEPLPDPDPILPEGYQFVPTVINKSLTDCEERLSEKKLDYTITGRVYDYEIPSDYILTQSIHGGTVVPENTTIDVTVSSMEMIIVPSVVGTDKNEAVQSLENMGFIVVTKEEYSSVIAENCIISQSLEADSEQQYGSEIELVVSKGKDPNTKQEVKEITLPDFVGKSYNEVIKQAGELGITVKISEQKYSKTYAKDTVMEQNPKSGSKMTTDKEVKLTISLGYEKIAVPDVTYKTEEEARTTLESRGLKVKVTYKTDDKTQEGNVISQDPTAKTEVDPETTVTIVVSKGAESFKMPDVVGKQESDATSTLSSKGLVVSISYKEDNNYTEGEVLLQSISPNTDVKKGNEVVLTVCTHSSVVAVPNVVGKSQNDAIKLISDMGLKYYLAHVYDDKVEQGLIVKQSPSSGSGLKKGDTVTIEVSDGKDPTSKTPTSSTVSDKENESSGITSSHTISVPLDIQPDKVEFDINTLSLVEGTTGKVTAIVSPSNATNKNVSWRSSNDSVASVNNGVITANNAGTATITAQTVNGKTAACAVTVTGKEIQPSSVSLNKSSMSLTENSSEGLVATVSPSNATNKSVSWSSDNKSVAVVNSSGVVTSNGPGQATITVKTVNGKTASCQVTVTPTIISISLNKSSMTLTEGDYEQLVATVSPSGQVFWESSNELVATVDVHGVVSAKSPGKTTITAQTIEGRSATCAVTVKSKTVMPSSISLNTNSITITEGETESLSATVSPNNATDKTVTWSSSNNSVVTVNSSGLITAKSAGTAIISAETVNGLSASCDVTVNPQGRESVALTANGNCGGNIQWELYESGNLYIFGNGNMDNYSNSPWEGYYVNTITIEDGVTSIGNNAFRNNSGVSTVSIAASVEEIGYRAFSYCSGLESVYFKGSIPRMDPDDDAVYVFENTKTAIFYPRNNSSWNDVENNWHGGGLIARFSPFDP